MLILRSSTSVLVSKKIFGIINKRGCPTKQALGDWKKNQKINNIPTFIWHSRVRSLDLTLSFLYVKTSLSEFEPEVKNKPKSIQGWLLCIT